MAASPAKPRVRAGLCTDVQYADKPTSDARPAKRYAEAVDRLRFTAQAFSEVHLHQTPLDVLFHLGDIIDGNETLDKSRADLEHVMNEFDSLTRKHPELPLHHVIGNHCLRVPRQELYARLGFSSDSASTWYTLKYEGIRFVILNGCHVSLDGWREEVDDDAPELVQAHHFLDTHPLDAFGYAERFNGGVGKGQLEWFRNELAAAASHNVKVIVLCHFPLLEEASNIRHLLWDKDDVLAVLHEYNRTVVAWMNGHYHAGGYAFHDGIHHITFQAVLETDPAQGSSHAIIDVFEDRLQVDGHGSIPSCVLPFHEPRTS
mmetsp:Transcript_23683/g.59281  ORF Transcript_23683/g.59281 Transcript_23683/m.59281 type:complete len:317 (+) Transcript_23683:73-1023(+)